VALNAVAQGLHVEQRPQDFKAPLDEEVVAWFKQLLVQSAVKIWIAEEASTPIGYVVAMMRELPENPFCPARRWCEVDAIAVHPNHRRQGVARSLVEACVDYAAAEGVQQVEASSWSFNETAHHMFESLGFSRKTLRFERVI